MLHCESVPVWMVDWSNILISLRSTMKMLDYWNVLVSKGYRDVPLPKHFNIPTFYRLSVLLLKRSTIQTVHYYWHVLSPKHFNITTFYCPNVSLVKRSTVQTVPKRLLSNHCTMKKLHCLRHRPQILLLERSIKRKFYHSDAVPLKRVV